MDKTVRLAKENSVRVGAHPSLPDRQGFGRREMSMEPDELTACFVYQVGALCGFLKCYDIPLNHIKPHGSVYGMTARDINLARAVVQVSKSFDAPFMGLAGTCHQQACEEMGVPFIAEWFADLDYDASGQLIITKKHDPVPLATVEKRVKAMLETRNISTLGGPLPLPASVAELSICCHSDTPGAVEIANVVKSLVDAHNALE
ncbi:hypothetical protein EIP86_001153 [Pleurotus ostreatoroseus]|nr:hypothetical protein EIP86_001153 [Pleurotus ostreatoroseus]